MNTSTLIAALEAELAGYLRRGLADRAAAVQEELVRLGKSVATTAADAVLVEPDSTPPKPTTRARKAVAASNQAKAPRTAKKGK